MINVPAVAAIATVTLLTAAVGARGVRIARTSDDFLVAAREVPPGLNAAAISGEYLSAASFLGIAGLIVSLGLGALWYSVGYTAGYLVLLLLVAAPLRRFGAYTIPDFAEGRLASRSLRRATTVLVLVIGWFYLLPQMKGAGITLQLDCPDLAMGRHSAYAQMDTTEFRRRVALNIEALNHAVRGIPADRLRMHLCWGNYPGPHHRDVPLEQIIDLILTVRAHGLSFEAANGRHAHEWKVFEKAKLPEGKVLIPGVIESMSNRIEHPELVAQRIVQLAKVVGRENVIAGSDCGFGTFVGVALVEPEIAWAKLGSLVEGARLATEELW